MNNKEISILDALKFGFSNSLNYAWSFIKLPLMYFLGAILVNILFFIIIKNVLIGIGLISSENMINIISSSKNPTILEILLHIVSSILVTLLGWKCWYETINLALNAYNNKPINPAYYVFNIFDKNYIKFLFAQILYILKIFFGLIFFIIPGLYFLTKYFFTGYSIIEKDNSIKEDRIFNAAITKGNKMKILIYLIMQILTIGSIITFTTLALYLILRSNLSFTKQIFIIIPIVATYIFTFSIWYIIFNLANVHLYKQASNTKNFE